MAAEENYTLTVVMECWQKKYLNGAMLSMEHILQPKYIL